jgi:hypothetical protein
MKEGMMADEKSYEPANYLLVDIVQAGSDLIESAGYAKGSYCRGQPIDRYTILDMEKAAQKALDSIKSYKIAVEKVGPKGTLPRAEYRGAA